MSEQDFVPMYRVDVEIFQRKLKLDEKLKGLFLHVQMFFNRFFFFFYCQCVNGL